VHCQVIAGALLTTIALTGCKESSWTPMGSAELILSEMKLRGPDAVSKRLDSDENFGRSVTAGIATGDSAWLEVADKITPASSAAEASVTIALASALSRSPARVLALIGNKYPLEEVCGIPFLKADSLDVMTYHDSASASLQGIGSPALVAVRDRCRAALDEGRDKRLERINPGYLIKNKPAAASRRR
jgi:hypothetical protein